jgi:hypothetical protein
MQHKIWRAKATRSPGTSTMGLGQPWIPLIRAPAIRGLDRELGAVVYCRFRRSSPDDPAALDPFRAPGLSWDNQR